MYWEKQFQIGRNHLKLGERLLRLPGMKSSNLLKFSFFSFLHRLLHSLRASRPPLRWRCHWWTCSCHKHPIGRCRHWRDGGSWCCFSKLLQHGGRGGVIGIWGFLYNYVRRREREREMDLAKPLFWKNYRKFLGEMVGCNGFNCRYYVLRILSCL